MHRKSDLCIIIARPPPRWTKWSRGVRTRGLRVGLVGGPRPLLFLGLLKSRDSSLQSNKSFQRLTFNLKGITYPTDNQPPGRFIYRQWSIEPPAGEQSPQSALFLKLHAVAFLRSSAGCRFATIRDEWLHLSVGWSGVRSRPRA